MKYFAPEGLSITKNLAKAASQRLKGVVVEYSVICRSLVRTNAPEPEDDTMQGTKKEDTPAVSNRLVSQAELRTRALSVITYSYQSLPGFFQRQLPHWSTGRKVNGELEKKLAQAQKDGSEQHIMEQLAQSIPLGKEAKVVSSHSPPKIEEDTSIREKYLDKLQAIKKRAAAEKETRSSIGLSSAYTKGVPKWRVNEGTSDFLRYLQLRGISLSIIPPKEEHEQELFQEFYNQLKDQIDLVVSNEDRHTLPASKPLLQICNDLKISPHHMMVIASSDEIIKSAGLAECIACRYRPKKNVFSGSSRSDYTFKSLSDLKPLIEDLNGISYRRMMND